MDIRKSIKLHGVTLAEVAIRLNTSVEELREELANVDNLTILRAQQIADAIGVTLTELVAKGEDDAEN